MVRQSADSMAGSLREEKSLICRNIRGRYDFYATLPVKGETDTWILISFGDGQK